MDKNVINEVCFGTLVQIGCYYKRKFHLVENKETNEEHR